MMISIGSCFPSELASIVDTNGDAMKQNPRKEILKTNSASIAFGYKSFLTVVSEVNAAISGQYSILVEEVL